MARYDDGMMRHLPSCVPSIQVTSIKGDTIYILGMLVVGREGEGKNIWSIYLLTMFGGLPQKFAFDVASAIGK